MFPVSVNPFPYHVSRVKQQTSFFAPQLKTMRRIFIATALILLTSLTHAQDRFFARTYTTNILPKGSVDLEFWHTSRFGHENQYYHAQDQRMELEFGLGHNWQTAFYFNRYQERYSDSSDGTLTSNEIGFSNEWKWKLSDPTLNRLGAALYGEWGVKGGDELEFEGKLILDKYVGKSLFAFNGVFEYEKEFEWEDGKSESGESETPVEFDLAYMYNFNSSFGLGFELRNLNQIEKDEGWKNSVLYGGPTINYRTGKWFVIANYLPQWVNLHKTDESPGSKVLDDQERTEARILVGISF